MTRAALALMLGVGLGCVAYVADAATADAHARHHSSLRIRGRRVLGFHVRSVSFRPGDHYKFVVRYSRTVRTVPHWAGARHRRTRTVAAINGNTWIWRTLRPVGTIRSRGHWVSRVSNAPAVGFKGRGHMIFGARSAKR